MRRCIAALVLLAICVASAQAFGYADDLASIGFDTVMIADLARRKDPDLCCSLRLRLSEGFELKLPVTAVLGTEGTFVDSGLMLVYYPFGIGPFVSLSLLQFGVEFGHRLLDERIIALNETCLGWTWNFVPAWFVEVCVQIRNPSGTFDEEYERIRGAFPNYGTFRIRLTLGWNFIRRLDNGQKT